MKFYIIRTRVVGRTLLQSSSMIKPTHKLLQDGERPLTVGTWFSLGHSTVVVGLVVALVVATKSVANQIPGLQSSGAIIGTTVSGIFLFLIGLVNAIIVMGIYQTFKPMKEVKLNQSELQLLFH